MKTPLKLTLAAIAASVIATAGAFADDVRLTQICNHHGARTFVYRQVEQPSTVAIYSNGSGVGQRSLRDSTENQQQFRLEFRPNHHGSERAVYVAE